MAASFKDVDFQHVTPATRLLEKRRQVLEVQEALDAQKEEFERREELFKQREEQVGGSAVEDAWKCVTFGSCARKTLTFRSRLSASTSFSK